MTKDQHLFQDAVIRLLKRRPFYGHLMLAFRRRVGGSPYPLGVTLVGALPLLEVNPERFGEFSAPEQEALLEHCIKHVLHLHMARRKERHGLTWDTACDLAINPTIADLPAAAPVPARFNLADGLAAEEYYELLARPFDTGNLEGQGLGSATRESCGDTGAGDQDHAGQEAAPLDDHSLWAEADAVPQRLAEQTVRGLVQDAWRKSDGEVPGDLKALVTSMLAPAPIPWRQVLRQFVATAGRVGRQSTWKREHRRFAHSVPGQRKRRRLNLLIGVDVSDSTNEQQLREAFAAELMRIARGGDTLLTVLYAGSRIQKIESFRGNQAVAEVYHGGGFTDLRPVFDYARTLQPRPAAVIYLTDGYGEAPARMEFPTLWVLTKTGQKPTDWGVELRLDN
ncbi:vWA domain-containing protein [Geoalkalibacter halelectricus]|uniref:VWA-like domain-containing protein n=1 Tax=Geoalkalibacter halelectricus TaxID=2847045 RepID=A0ABY5ZLX4_9BACT|nr:VWA-like domain-containing protein [Geoalkalibacter halelectricus]MDO3378841.1 VWA-like domain-containing protein [Geoalkalibacter halelectricus]UWZ79854.1 VWA-like domain-containing protein [Geoalkalibacter halelectricus]